jgi:hypothetical protein
MLSKAGLLSKVICHHILSYALQIVSSVLGDAQRLLTLPDTHEHLADYILNGTGVQ